LLFTKFVVLKKHSKITTTTTMKKHNYSAGPCILPQEVFEKSAQAILNFNNSGLSILEISNGRS
jgi:phosphoserine aminotransferase